MRSDAEYSAAYTIVVGVCVTALGLALSKWWRQFAELQRRSYEWLNWKSAAASMGPKGEPSGFFVVLNRLVAAWFVVLGVAFIIIGITDL
jgi:hypothetical protein